MANEEKRIRLKIDVASGTIELEAPAESFDHAIEKTRELASTLDLSGGRSRTLAEVPAESPAPDQTASQSSPAAAAMPRPRGRAGKTASSGRPGRIGSFEEIRGFLTEAQEIELRRFMAEKAPAEQPDQVLVAIVKGEQLLERKGFSFNEIYTLLWLAGVKDLPKALDVVLQRLMKDQMVVREENGFAAKFIGRNRVERELPGVTA